MALAGAASLLARLSLSAPQQLAAVQRISSSAAASHYLMETDITSEWYLRQRTRIRLGNRAPDLSPDLWVAPNAVIIGDVDVNPKVRGCMALQVGSW